MQEGGGLGVETNVKGLRDYFEQRGMSVESAAEKIGIDKATLYRKLKSGGSKFTVGEVQRMMESLPMSRDMAVNIFFPQNSQ